MGERSVDERDQALSASWLSRNILLVTGRFPGDAGAPEVSARVNSAQVPLESRYASLATSDTGAGGGDQPGLMAIFPPSVNGASPFEGELEIQAAGQRLELDLRRGGAGVTDLKTLVRNGLAPLSAAARNQALEFLAALAGARAESGKVEMSETLSSIRGALRERLPSYVQMQSGQRGVCAESIMAVDERSFYMVGWLHDGEAEIVRVTAVSPEGARAELRDRLFRYPRPDVSDLFSNGEAGISAKPGFICFFELETPSPLSEGWIIEMENADGGLVEAPVPPVVRDMGAVRDAIINDPARERYPVDELMENHIFPAVSRIQERVERSIEVESVTQFGMPPEDPDISIVVPLYRRIDLIEQQLAEFADDPELHRADLVYVLDSPEQKEELLDFAGRLLPIYRIPLRVAVLDQNVGFAGANNAGVSLARGRLLVLMNSDVLPARPGWLGAMSAFYDKTPNIGAMTPKLLYEDDSIQHAGMYLYQPPGSSVWQDAHYFKGLRSSFPAANVARPVPGLAAACMMIERDLYDSVGGLRGIYVRGDYEDFDLCLRLSEAGRENWYVPSVEMYHLEALSYTISDLRFMPNRYNNWVHTHLWRDRIETLMQDDRFQFGHEVGADGDLR